MLNSCAFRTKTARTPAGSPCRGKPSRDKRLRHGLSGRCRQVYQISRNVLKSIRQQHFTAEWRCRPIIDVTLVESKASNV